MQQIFYQIVLLLFAVTPCFGDHHFESFSNHLNAEQLTKDLVALCEAPDEPQADYLDKANGTMRLDWLFGNTNVNLRRSAQRHEASRWPDRTMPYLITLKPSMTTREQARVRGLILEAMGEIELKTCFRFRDCRPTDLHCVEIVLWDNERCQSAVGRQAHEARQKLLLGTSCIEPPEKIETDSYYYGKWRTVHELMHTMGFWHEHVRPDRDEWVFVNFTNIEDDAHIRMQYKKVGKVDVTDLGLEYDYFSIMHYSMNAHAIDKGINTMKPLKYTGGAVLGEMNGLSRQFPCEVSEWNKWSPCSCETRLQSRDRTVVAKPRNGGSPCPALTDEQSCNPSTCDVQKTIEVPGSPTTVLLLQRPQPRAQQLTVTVDAIVRVQTSNSRVPAPNFSPTILVAADRRLYAAGARTFGKKRVEVYNGLRWKRLPDTLQPRYKGTISYLPNVRKLFVCGCWPTLLRWDAGRMECTQSCEHRSIDDDRRPWTKQDTPRGMCLFHHAAAVYQDIVFITAGVDCNGQRTDRLLRFDFENGWSKLSGMQKPRQVHGMVVHNNALVVCGGTQWYEQDAMEHCEKYNFGLDKWSPMAPMPIKLFGQRMLSVGYTPQQRRILVIGGAVPLEMFTKANRIIYSYDEVSDSWTTAGSINNQVDLGEIAVAKMP